uniref:CCHC-type domain-containing protein n=1 Tax=Cannabis sativa TaxID=3483 RepID=A0A803PSM6_CANSA
MDDLTTSLSIALNLTDTENRSKGLFLIEFGCEGDRRRVLLQQPWSYLNQPILMDIPNSVDSLSPPLSAISLRFIGLPFGKLGDPIFRIRVMFDVAQPLPRGIPINFSWINKVVWLELKYENLSDICFFCGRMGHSYNKDCVDYMKACDEAPLPPDLRYDIKTISGKVKIYTNPMLYCPEQLTFTTPPVATFMATNPTSAVCVSLPDSMPPFPTHAPHDQNPTLGQTQLVGLFKSDPSTHSNETVPWNQTDTQPLTTFLPQPEANLPTFTALLNATMSNTCAQNAPQATTPSFFTTSQNSSSTKSTSTKHCHVLLPVNIPVLVTSKRLEAMNLSYQRGVATPSSSKDKQKKSKSKANESFKRQAEMVNGEIRQTLLSWNARGIRSDRAFRNFSCLVSSFGPDILFIMESRLVKNVVDKLRIKLNFDSGLEVPRIGRGGGLLLLWNNDVILTLLSQSISHFDCYVSIPTDNVSFHLTCFYGSPFAAQRPHTWKILNRIGNNNPMDPWLVIGDFNAFLNLDDKHGGNPDRGPSSDFRRFLDSFNFSPLDPKGPLLTWNNNVASLKNIQEHIDWGIINPSWSNLFPDALLSHLGFFGSDQRVLEHVTNSTTTPILDPGKKRSFFENVWLSEPN